MRFLRTPRWIFMLMEGKLRSVYLAFIAEKLLLSEDLWLQSSHVGVLEFPSQLCGGREWGLHPEHAVRKHPPPEPHLHLCRPPLPGH